LAYPGIWVGRKCPRQRPGEGPGVDPFLATGAFLWPQRLDTSIMPKSEFLWLNLAFVRTPALNLSSSGPPVNVQFMVKNDMVLV
jgi:hypothetical protein